MKFLHHLIYQTVADTVFFRSRIVNPSHCESLALQKKYSAYLVIHLQVQVNLVIRGLFICEFSIRGPK